MHKTMHIARHSSLILSISCILLLTFAFSACGTNTNTTTTAGNAGAAVTPTATATGQSTSNGCLSNASVTPAPARADVVLTPSNSNTTINASQGNVIEFDLPFGRAWGGPTNTVQKLLTLQQPAGYTSSTAKACVWRFVAAGTGTVQLTFISRPICKKGMLCPMYVMALPFTIKIQ